MLYRWKKNVDVDETIVVIKNSLNENPELPPWLVRTVSGSIVDSDPKFAKYFFSELKKYLSKDGVSRGNNIIRCHRNETMISNEWENSVTIER